MCNRKEKVHTKYKGSSSPQRTSGDFLYVVQGINTTSRGYANFWSIFIGINVNFSQTKNYVFLSSITRLALYKEESNNLVILNAKFIQNNLCCQHVQNISIFIKCRIMFMYHFCTILCILYMCVCGVVHS